MEVGHVDIVGRACEWCSGRYPAIHFKWNDDWSRERAGDVLLLLSWSIENSCYYNT